MLALFEVNSFEKCEVASWDGELSHHVQLVSGVETELVEPQHRARYVAQLFPLGARLAARADRLCSARYAFRSLRL